VIAYFKLTKNIIPLAGFNTI